MKKKDKLIVCFFGDPMKSARRTQIAVAVDFACELADDCGLAITHLSCQCHEPRKGIVNNKLYSFPRSAARILEENERGNLSYLDLCHWPAKKDSFVSFDWLLEVEAIHVQEGGAFDDILRSSFLVGIDVRLLKRCGCAATLDGVFALCRRMAQVMRARYGLVDIMRSKFMPAGYSVDLA